MAREPNKTRKRREPSDSNDAPVPMRDRSFPVVCDRDSGRYMSYFMSQELAYYNHLVSMTQPSVRSRPQLVMDIKGPLAKLWGLCAELACDPVALSQQDRNTWPERMQAYHDLIMDRNQCTIEQLAFIAMASSPAKIHPEVRRNMAVEVLKYIQPQCEIIEASLRSGREGLRAPLQMLNTHDEETRFSVQLHRNMVNMAWDADKKATRVSTPYAPHQIMVRDWDLTRPGWTYLVIRENEPMRRRHESYVLSIMTTTQPYLLNWSDGQAQRIKRVY